jgi:hypothetical protein
MNWFSLGMVPKPVIVTLLIALGIPGLIGGLLAIGADLWPH